MDIKLSAPSCPFSVLILSRAVTEIRSIVLKVEAISSAYIFLIFLSALL